MLKVLGAINSPGRLCVWYLCTPALLRSSRDMPLNRILGCSILLITFITVAFQWLSRQRDLIM